MNDTKATREPGKPKHLPHPDAIDTQLLDVHTVLPALARRYATLYHRLWTSRPGTEITVVISGHSDPTGDTVATSQRIRDELAEAGDLILTLCATARGIDAALNRVAGTTPIDGTQQAADQAGNRTRCKNCRDHAPTRRGRCNACDHWWRRHGQERPPHQWQQHHHGGKA